MSLGAAHHLALLTCSDFVFSKCHGEASSFLSFAPQIVQGSMLMTWACEILSVYMCLHQTGLKNPGVCHFGTSRNGLDACLAGDQSCFSPLLCVICIIIFSIIALPPPWQILNHVKLYILVFLVSSVPLSASDRNPLTPLPSPLKLYRQSFVETTEGMGARLFFLNGYGCCDLWRCRPTFLTFIGPVNSLYYRFPL